MRSPVRVQGSCSAAWRADTAAEAAQAIPHRARSAGDNTEQHVRALARQS